MHITFASKFDMINKALEEVTDWYKANRLSANASKTNFMPLGTHHKSSRLDESAYFRRYKLKRVNNTTFPGVTRNYYPN